MGSMVSHLIIPIMHLLYFYIFIIFIYHHVILFFYPKSFWIFTMIHVPKGSNKNTSDIRNYRGIALSNLLWKVFDSCIILLKSVVLRSDDLQFAYTMSCYTIQCVSMVTEVIHYYENNGSSVYMCMIDASKAFGKVNLMTLFKTLYSRGMCSIYLLDATRQRRLKKKVNKREQRHHQLFDNK